MFCGVFLFYGFSEAEILDWEQVNEDGFGNNYNHDVKSMVIYNNYLYVGTHNYYSTADRTTGAEILRTKDGNSWSKVYDSTDNSDNASSIETLAVFNNYLYAGTEMTFVWGDHSKILRTSNGSNWTEVYQATTSDTISYLIPFGDYLYAGYETGGGSSSNQIIMRCSKTSDCNDNSDWNITADLTGAGGSKNRGITSMVVFNNYLYASTDSWNTQYPAEVWRTQNGTVWQEVNNDGFGETVWDMNSLTLYNNYLYVFLDGPGGDEIWRTSNGMNWEKVNVQGVNLDKYEGYLSACVFNNELYIGTTHGNIYSSVNGVDYILVNNVSDEYYGYSVYDMINFGNYLYVAHSGTTTDYDSNEYYGVKIYRTDGSLAPDTPSDGDTSSTGGVIDERTDSEGNTVLADLNPKILTTSGPGEPARLQAYSKGNTDGANSLLDDDITTLFPDSYTGGAGIVPIDQNNNSVLDQFLIYAINNGGPQARVMGLKSDGSLSSLGQQFVFDSSIRDGLSATSGDFDNDGYQDDAAFCLTGDIAPTVRVYTDVSGIDNWNLAYEFTAPFGNVGCNLGTFQYDQDHEEILVTPNHGPADPNVYIYWASGELKNQFSAYGSGLQSGLTATGIQDRIYTTPNNGSSQVNAFDKTGERKNFWWVYEEHVRGDFSIRSAQLDPATDKQELLISPIGSNGPHILGYKATGEQKATPNFFAFNDPSLRNGVGIATIENWHGIN